MRECEISYGASIPAAFFQPAPTSALPARAAAADDAEMADASGSQLASTAVDEGADAEALNASVDARPVLRAMPPVSVGVTTRPNDRPELKLIVRATAAENAQLKKKFKAAERAQSEAEREALSALKSVAVSEKKAASAQRQRDAAEAKAKAAALSTRAAVATTKAICADETAAKMDALEQTMAGIKAREQALKDALVTGAANARTARKDGSRSRPKCAA